MHEENTSHDCLPVLQEAGTVLLVPSSPSCFQMSASQTALHA